MEQRRCAINCTQEQQNYYYAVSVVKVVIAASTVSIAIS